MKNKNNKIVIITGGVHEGKTTFAADVVGKMRAEEVDVQGFLSPGTFIFGIRNSFSLVDLHTGTKMDLSTTTARKNWQSFKRFYFNPEALQWGNHLLKNVPNHNSSVVFIDEVGLYELDGGGWNEGVFDLLKKDKPAKVFITRKNITGKIIDYFDMHQPQIFSLSENTPQEVAAKIISFAKSY